MHYFKRHIGEYAKKAGRLSMLQHGSYTLLMDACYDREKFPTLEEAIEWSWASTKEEREAVEFVLHKFFVLTDGVFVQPEIQADIAEYHGKAETNKRIAIERETKRKANSTNRAQAVDEAPPNHKPLTTNQEPLTKNKDKVNTIVGGKPPRKTRAADWTEEFDAIWSAYPRKPGMSKADTLKAFTARVGEGASVTAMHAGVEAYAAYVLAMGTEAKYIKSPETFFGPGKHWESDWTPPPRASPGAQHLTKAGQATARNIEAWLQEKQGHG